ncbi:hypothetical protein FOBRF1_001565 [Fusarium oxysporum]
MRAGNYFLSALSLAANLYSSEAAECGGWGRGGGAVGPCTDRKGNYKDREAFCNRFAGQGSWKKTCENGLNAWDCHFEYQGSKMDNQMCYDAFESIINQCFPSQHGSGYHYGTWSVPGHWFALDRCSP